MSELTHLITDCLKVHASIPNSPEYRLASLASQRIKELETERDEAREIAMRIASVQQAKRLAEKFGYDFVEAVLSESERMES